MTRLMFVNQFSNRYINLFSICLYIVNIFAVQSFFKCNKRYTNGPRPAFMSGTVLSSWAKGAEISKSPWKRLIEFSAVDCTALFNSCICLKGLCLVMACGNEWEAGMLVFSDSGKRKGSSAEKLQQLGARTASDIVFLRRLNFSWKPVYLKGAYMEHVVVWE